MKKITRHELNDALALWDNWAYRTTFLARLVGSHNELIDRVERLEASTLSVACP